MIALFQAACLTPAYGLDIFFVSYTINHVSEKPDTVEITPWPLPNGTYLKAERDTNIYVITSKHTHYVNITIHDTTSHWFTGYSEQLPLTGTACQWEVLLERQLATEFATSWLVSATNYTYREAYAEDEK